ncbi:TerB family tellurite resistance protein [bacterium]|nr:TerB family tellurite resistance protein [bacterium]
MTEAFMSVPFKALTQSQRFWYAEMVIAAVLADGEISQPETEFIKDIVHLVKTPEQKQELLGRLASKRPPPISRPSGVPPGILAAVFLELSLVLISDAELTPEEKRFLEESARVFRFSEPYFKALMDWCNEGLAWKKEQIELISSDGKMSKMEVPVHRLNDDQLLWYAETLVATIMSDEQLDASEVRFLKIAIDLVKDETTKQRLTEMVRQNTAPPLRRHPGIDEDILKQVFFEVMLIISADESLHEKEEAYLKQLADHSGFSDAMYQRMVNWCHQGIKWKQSKNALIENCQIIQESDGLQLFKGNRDDSDSQAFAPEPEVVPEAELPVEEAAVSPSPVPASQPNRESNAITDFNLNCFICGSKDVVKHFYLKPRSLKASSNIFGIPVYHVSADGFDFVDYNRCKVTICPSCFFASTQKQMFRQKADAQLPKVLQHPEFRDVWLKGRERRSQEYRDFRQEIPSLKRSTPMVLKSYETAIETSTTLADLNQSYELSWHTITLRLTLAEVLMSLQKPEEAVQLLRNIQQKAAELFKTVKSRFITFRSGRLVMLIAVFLGNEKIADHYFNYFQKLKTQKFDQMKAEDQKLFKLVFGEMKRAYQNKAVYFHKNMNGFKLKKEIL